MKMLARLGIALALLFAPSVAFAQTSACPSGSIQARLITGTTYTVGQTDQCQLLVFNNASAIAVSLPAPGTAGGYLPGFFSFQIETIGAGTVTITPSAPFSGSAPTINGQTTAVSATNDGMSIYVGTDGNYYANGTLTNLPGRALCTATGASPQTCNSNRGIVTSGTLTTAASTAATYTINDSSVVATSLILCTNQGYSGTYITNGVPEILDCKAGAGTITVDFANTNATNALNGTVKFGFSVLN